MEYSQNLVNLDNLQGNHNLEVLLLLSGRVLICKYHKKLHLNKFHNLEGNQDSHSLELNMSRQDKCIEELLLGFTVEYFLYKCHRMLHQNKFHNLEDNLDSHSLELNMSRLDKYIEG
jgi:hypothetical protein